MLLQSFLSLCVECTAPACKAGLFPEAEQPQLCRRALSRALAETGETGQVRPWQQTCLAAELFLHQVVRHYHGARMSCACHAPPHWSFFNGLLWLHLSPASRRQTHSQPTSMWSGLHTRHKSPVGAAWRWPCAQALSVALAAQEIVEELDSAALVSPRGDLGSPLGSSERQGFRV